MSELTIGSQQEDDADADPLAPDDDAPFGYTIDRLTGDRRPKRKAGRPRAAPASSPAGQPGDILPPGEPLTAEQLREGKPVERQPDREPGKGTPRRAGRAPRDDSDAPPFRAGPIAKGMNRLYAKTGKIVRAMDRDIGQAIIDATRKESEDDVTIGEAWEELARVNPRIRKVLMKLIAGGAWGQLVMAHMPILLAVIMKPAILKHVPFHKLIESLAEPDDDDTPAGEGGLPGGMTAADAGQMADLARKQMEQMGIPVSAELAAQMGAMAGSMMGNGQPPGGKGTIRNQPRRPASRAGRRGS